MKFSNIQTLLWTVWSTLLAASWILAAFRMSTKGGPFMYLPQNLHRKTLCSHALSWSVSCDSSITGKQPLFITYFEICLIFLTPRTHRIRSFLNKHWPSNVEALGPKSICNKPTLALSFSSMRQLLPFHSVCHYSCDTLDGTLTQNQSSIAYAYRLFWGQSFCSLHRDFPVGTSR